MNDPVPVPAPLPEDARAHTVLDLVCDGASVRDACVRVGLPRTTLYRLLDTDAALRERYALALQLRAHACADLIEDIASGRESADATARAVLDAIADVDPAKVEKVARAVLRESVQRDRLRMDAARWIAARMYAGQYAADAAPSAKVPAVHRVQISFEPPPPHVAAQLSAGGSTHDIPEADYETIEQ